MSSQFPTPMQPTVSKQVIINLNKIYENQPNQNWWFNTKENQHSDAASLHKSEAATLTLEIWDAVLYNHDSSKNHWSKGWTNLNYFISGERGSGKSTFLQYVSRCITRKTSPFDKKDASPIPEIPAIDLLFCCDPTAMTSNENFFISIIAALKDWLRKRTKTCNAEEDHYRRPVLAIPQKEKIFLDQIQSLALGIRQLNDGKSSSKSELDPVSQLNMGMANSAQALKLKKDFDKLINEITIAYGINAFLIAIDDADIEFTQNKRIIEILRTYLTHPRLIILFTGDTFLTHEAIREKQFGQFDFKFHKADIANQKRRWELTDAMTAQYLKKIFPPSNHLQLTSLYDTVQAHPDTIYKICYDLHGQQKEEPLLPFLQRLFKDILDSDEERASYLLEGFLRLPLRSIMHTLRFWTDNDIIEQFRNWAQRADLINEMFLKKDISQEEKRQIYPMLKETISHRRAIAHELAKSFRSAFNDELISQGFSKEELEMSTPYQLAKGLLLHCFNSKDISYGHRLSISSCRYNNQESTFFLLAKETVLLKNFSDTLFFTLFGGFTIHAYRYYQQTCIVRDVQPELASYDITKVAQYLRHKQQSFTDYLFSSSKEDPLRWTNKLSLIFLVHRETSFSVNGTDKPPIHLSRGIYYLSQKKDLELLDHILLLQINKFDDSDASDQEKQTAFYIYLMLLISCGRASNYQNVFYLSAYNIFGFILQCYKECERADASYDKTETREERLVCFLQKLIDDFIKAHDMPIWGGVFPLPEECADIQTHRYKISIEQQFVKGVVDDIISWYDKCSAFIPLFAYQLGQAADSIYHDICDISNQVLSATLKGTPLHNTAPLREVLAQLIVRLPGKTDKKATQETEFFFQHLSEFPLCQNPQELCKEIWQAAAFRHKPDISTSDIHEWLNDLNRKIALNRRDIERTQGKIKAYFPRFKETRDFSANMRTFLFCDNREKTLGASRTLQNHFSRINGDFRDMAQALRLCKNNGRAIKPTDPHNYDLLRDHIWTELRLCKTIRDNSRSFRNDVREAFMEGLQIEIASHSADFREERRQLNLGLKYLLTKTQKFISGKASKRLGSIKPTAMKNAARTAIKLYADWKGSLNEIETLNTETAEWIRTLRDNPHMNLIRQELNISVSQYEAPFSAYSDLLAEQQTDMLPLFEQSFNEYADHLRLYLSMLDDEIGHLHFMNNEKLAQTHPSQRDTFKREMLTDLEKIEESLTDLQDILNLAVDGDESLRRNLQSESHADFAAEFGLREAFYNVFITLYAAQRDIKHAS